MINYDIPGGTRNSDGYDTYLMALTGEPNIPTRHFGWVAHGTQGFVIFGIEDLPGLGDRDWNDGTSYSYH